MGDNGSAFGDQVGDCLIEMRALVIFTVDGCVPAATLLLVGIVIPRLGALGTLIALSFLAAHPRE